MSRIDQWPSHLPGTRKQWLARKRREGLALLKALDAFRIGCAYLPPADYSEGGVLISEMENWIKGPCRKAWRNA